MCRFAHGTVCGTPGCLPVVPVAPAIGRIPVQTLPSKAQPNELTQFFSGTNLMIIFPDQYGDLMDNMTFATPQHTEDDSAYEAIRKLIFRK